MKQKLKNNKGITLIALVITIIVMLILVGVTIKVAQDGGLFKHAANAASKTKTAVEGENAILDGNIENISIEDIVAEQTGDTEEKFSGKYAQDADFTDKNGKTARIPQGFAVGTSRGINTVSGGLVITDHVAADGTSDGNEFVWIPVDDIDEFVRTGWATNASTSTEATLGIYYAEEEDSAYLAMKASVEKWKGFYIARYEAGTTAERTSKDKDSISDTVYSKKLMYPYNYINWTDSKALSEGMYTGPNYGVTSTLCYSVQWDSVMRFIKDTKNVSNSTSWGNYKDNTFDYEGKYFGTGEKWLTPEIPTKAENTGTLLQTGACADHQSNNIYDLAGNVSEWTMESNYSSRIFRGGSCGIKGDINPASGRNYNAATLTGDSLGFRPTLYVTSLT